MNIILEQLISVLIVLVLFLPAKKKETWSKHFLGVFIVYMILNNLLIVLPVYFPISNLFESGYNWTGKIYTYLLAIVFLTFYKKISFREFGLSLRQNKGSSSFLIRISISMVFFMLGYSYFFGAYKAGLESILFQLTMPSVIEEIVVRGILLTLLNQVLRRQMKIGDSYFGMGAIITSVLFGVWHGLSIAPDFSIGINWILFVYTAGLGFVFAIVRERTGSLLFPILLHILVNIMPNTLGYVF